MEGGLAQGVAEGEDLERVLKEGLGRVQGAGGGEPGQEERAAHHPAAFRVQQTQAGAEEDQKLVGRMVHAFLPEEEEEEDRQSWGRGQEQGR